MIEAKQIYSGQYYKNGKFIRIWDVTSEESEETTLEWCFENLTRKRLPSEGEWRKNKKRGGERFGDTSYYLSGYCTIRHMPEDYRFTVCEPCCR